MMRRRLLAALFFAFTIAAAQDRNPAQPVIRATAILNGVFSPRGFFNIMVRLYELDGVTAAKLDLKKSQITLDFQPGISVAPEEIHQVMIDAGYAPGPVEIKTLRPDEVSETGPGWVKIKHPKSKNPIIRWFQLNF